MGTLKALESGLLLVSGPFKINGVPIRRVNQAYVIATKTSVNVSKVNVSKFTDEYFSREKQTTEEGEDDFFKGDAPRLPLCLMKERQTKKLLMLRFSRLSRL